MNEVLMIVMAVGAVLGGVDRLRGNKWGFGDKFETGFMLLGSMALSMAGMICLAPVLANWLGRVIVPLYQLMGVDPGMFGSVLAIDMGGYQLSKELARDPQIGSYAGLVVAAIFGCTLVFTVPVGMGLIQREDRPFFAQGVMLGLAAMPVGLAVGGLLCGLTLLECLWQNLPVFLLAVLLFIGLRLVPDKMVKGFCLLSEGIRWLVTIGLVLAAVESMTGWNPIPGMTPIAEAMGTVASIGVVLLGSLPMAELIRRLLVRPFAWLGDRLGMKPQSLTGMLVGLVSALPTLSMYKDMDSRGKVAAGAFLVSGTSLLAAHMAFVVSTEPPMLLAVLAAKLAGALAAVALALTSRKKEAGA
ncbi:MAG: ethanolamine utilization protein EutH [Acutalibacter sp.]|nr:ethanolamine utilization protein EutH [Acutalibacter sp.]